MLCAFSALDTPSAESNAYGVLALFVPPDLLARGKATRTFFPIDVISLLNCLLR